MTVHSTSTSRSVTGVYRVTQQQQGAGIDAYFRVSGPDGRVSEQRVDWYPSMTALQVAEAAVDAHLGADGAAQVTTATSRLDFNEGGFVVTLA